MSEQTHASGERHDLVQRDAGRQDVVQQDLQRQERDDFRTYVQGACLALLATIAPFALVHWPVLPRLPLLAVIGAFALMQTLVHFRFFLHIDLRHKREDLLLLLFSALLLGIMVGGTVWIMASLAVRMTIPASP